MAVYTKTANDVFAPNDAGGTPRGVENGDAQRWGTEVERAVSDGAADVDAKVSAEAAARQAGDEAEAEARQQAISDEAAARQAADAGLSNRIDALAAVQRKDPVVAATTANGNLSNAFENGDAIDGVVLATGDRILIKNQTNATQNGIYTVNASGAPTRATDADSQDELLGANTYVMGGAENGGKTFGLATQAPIVVGTTALAWVQTAADGTPIIIPAARLFGRAVGEGTGAARPLTVPEVRSIIGTATSAANGLARSAALSVVLQGTGEIHDVVRTQFALELVQNLNDAHAFELAWPHPSEVPGSIYPLVTNDEGGVLLGIDTTTGHVIAAGISGGGNGVVTDVEASLLPYLDGNILHAVGADDAIVADLTGYDIKQIGAGNGGHVSVALDRPLLGATSVVGAGPARPHLLVPSVARCLYVFIGVGQSLMVGSQSASTLVSVIPALPDDVLMFDAGATSDVRMGLPTTGDIPVLNPAGLVGFRPLVARAGQGGGARGETPMEAFATNLSLLAREIGVKFRSLSFMAAQGGTGYDGIKKGTQVYANMIAALTKAKALAEAQGWQMVVAGVLHKHGETNANNASYFDYLIEWQADIDADVKAITGQALDVHFFMGQPSAFSTTTPNAVQGMVRAHNESPFHWLAGPDYPFGEFYAADETHMTGPGYFLIGEQMAFAYRDVMWGRGYKITQMTAAQRSGSTVTLTWDVPVPPLVFDTVTLSERKRCFRTTFRERSRSVRLPTLYWDRR